MSNAIKIESGVPIPQTAKSFAARYPWKEMNVGDSFLVPRAGDEPIGLVRGRTNKAVQYARSKFAMKFCTRTSEEGTRVWRLE